MFCGECFGLILHEQGVGFSCDALVVDFDYGNCEGDHSLLVDVEVLVGAVEDIVQECSNGVVGVLLQVEYGELEHVDV